MKFIILFIAVCYGKDVFIVDLPSCACDENGTLTCPPLTLDEVSCFGRIDATPAYVRLLNPTTAYYEAIIRANNRLPSGLSTFHAWIVHAGIFAYPAIVIGYLAINAIRAEPGQRWKVMGTLLGGYEAQVFYFAISMAPLFFVLAVTGPSMAASTDTTVPYVMFAMILVIDAIASSAVFKMLGFSCCAHREFHGKWRRMTMKPSSVNPVFRQGNQ
jgi:hypothetical protein